jgi:hypothetical protein
MPTHIETAWSELAEHRTVGWIHVASTQPMTDCDAIAAMPDQFVLELRSAGPILPVAVAPGHGSGTLTAGAAGDASAAGWVVAGAAGVGTDATGVGA